MCEQAKHKTGSRAERPLSNTMWATCTMRGLHMPDQAAQRGWPVHAPRQSCPPSKPSSDTPHLQDGPLQARARPLRDARLHNERLQVVCIPQALVLRRVHKGLHKRAAAEHRVCQHVDARRAGVPVVPGLPARWQQPQPSGSSRAARWAAAGQAGVTGIMHTLERATDGRVESMRRNSAEHDHLRKACA